MRRRKVAGGEEGGGEYCMLEMVDVHSLPRGHLVRRP